MESCVITTGEQRTSRGRPRPLPHHRAILAIPQDSLERSLGGTSLTSGKESPPASCRTSSMLTEHSVARDSAAGPAGRWQQLVSPVRGSFCRGGRTCPPPSAFPLGWMDGWVGTWPVPDCQGFSPRCPVRQEVTSCDEHGNDCEKEGKRLLWRKSHRFLPPSGTTTHRQAG